MRQGVSRRAAVRPRERCGTGALGRGQWLYSCAEVYLKPAQADVHALPAQPCKKHSATDTSTSQFFKRNPVLNTQATIPKQTARNPTVMAMLMTTLTSEVP